MVKLLPQIASSKYPPSPEILRPSANVIFCCETSCKEAGGITHAISSATCLATAMRCKLLETLLHVTAPKNKGHASQLFTQPLLRFYVPIGYLGPVYRESEDLG